MSASSLRLVPSPAVSAATISHTHPSTATSLGTHDALRAGHPHHPTASTHPASDHPTLALHRHLAQYDATQDRLRLEMARRVYGVAAPVRLTMERYMVAANTQLPGGPGKQNLGMDVLMGRDESVGWEDVLEGDGVERWSDVHGTVERAMWGQVL